MSGCSRRVANLNAEAQSTRRKTRRKAMSKPESAELAEIAEKCNF